MARVEDFVYLGHIIELGKKIKLLKLMEEFGLQKMDQISEDKLKPFIF